MFKNCLISYFATLLLIGFCISCNLFDEKPSEKDIKGIILRFMPDDNDFRLKYMYKFRDNKDLCNLKYDYFIIRNSFFSKNNDRYCVSVNYKISFERFTPYDKDKQWIFDSFEKVDGRYSFEKLGKLWYGSEGWGK